MDDIRYWISYTWSFLKEKIGKVYLADSKIKIWVLIKQKNIVLAQKSKMKCINISGGNRIVTGRIRVDVTSNKTSEARYEVRKSPNIPSSSVCGIKGWRLDCEKTLKTLINLQMPHTGLYCSVLLKCKYMTHSRGLISTAWLSVVEYTTHKHTCMHTHFLSSMQSSLLAANNSNYSWWCTDLRSISKR